MELDHVVSAIHPENKPSIRVAERLGEKLEGKTEVGGMPALIYGIDRPTYHESSTDVRTGNGQPAPTRPQSPAGGS